mgnify:CR=1 FL=1
MNKPAGLDNCLTFINCQLQPKIRPAPHSENGGQLRAVTISRQCGSGALVVAGKLAERLQPHSPKGAPPWTVFDRNLMEKVLEDHHLPKRLAYQSGRHRVTQQRPLRRLQPRPLQTPDAFNGTGKRRHQQQQSGAG